MKTLIHYLLPLLLSFSLCQGTEQLIRSDSEQQLESVENLAVLSSESTNVNSERGVGNLRALEGKFTIFFCLIIANK